MYCRHCGQELADQTLVCVHCGGATSNANRGLSRVAYVLLAVFLGSLGVHNFYAGYKTKAIIQLLITIFLGWLVLPYVAVYIWIVVEAITTKEDANGYLFE